MVYDMLNSKLGGQAKEGRWVRFDTESKASHVYWPDKHSVSVECNMQDHVLVQPIQPPVDPAPAETITQTSDLDSPPTAMAKMEPPTHGHHHTLGRGAQI